MKRFLAFDIETAKIIDDSARDLLAHRPLGIVCAAAAALDLREPLTWYGHDTMSRPSPRMTRDEASGLVSELIDLAAQGHTLVTWNGLGFDLNILGEESGRVEECARLALDHVDMLFQLLCSAGHLLSLQKAAEGMRLRGKTAGMSGAQAPVMWAEGKHDEVLRYCRRDAEVTMELAYAAQERKALSWVSQKGAVRQLLLPGGWLTVREAAKLPLPDTSWMSDPPTRARYLGWIPNGMIR